MELNNARLQLLANLKCLYGPNVEVVTLRTEALDGSHQIIRRQAVAMSFEPSTATWTKFLHGDSSHSTRDSIFNLLIESERELAKLFMANGIILPFQDNKSQTLTLCRGVRKDSDPGGSVHLEPDLVATPGSTFSDPVPKVSAGLQHVVDETASKEPPVDEKPLAEENIAVPLVPKPLCEEHLPDIQESEAVSSDMLCWENFKPDKKKMKRHRLSVLAKTQLEEDLPKEDHSTQVLKTTRLEEDLTARDISRRAEEVIAEAIAQRSPLEEEFIRKKNSSACDIVEQGSLRPSEPDEHAVEDSIGFGMFNFSKVDKKKKKKLPIQKETPFPTQEPSQDWSTWISKEIKNQDISLIEDQITLSIPPTEDEVKSIQEPIDDTDWLSWAPKKKKKKSRRLIEEGSFPPVTQEVEQVQKPAEKVDQISSHTHVSWMTQPASEPTIANAEERKLDEAPPKNPSSSLRSTLLSKPEPRTEDEGEPSTVEAPQTSETVEYPTPATSIAASTSFPITNIAVRPQTVGNRQPVVFTIKFLNDAASKPEHVMRTIADNTHTAMIESLNSYLDSKSMLEGVRSQRYIVISSGFGRHGDMDLSTVEDSMWPYYLDYFRQYTKIPELTVVVVD